MNINMAVHPCSPAPLLPLSSLHNKQQRLYQDLLEEGVCKCSLWVSNWGISFSWWALRNHPSGTSAREPGTPQNSQLPLQHQGVGTSPWVGRQRCPAWRRHLKHEEAGKCWNWGPSSFSSLQGTKGRGMRARRGWLSLHSYSAWPDLTPMMST